MLKSKTIATTLLGVLFALAAPMASAVLITNPANFTAPMTVIDYSNSPVGVLPGGTSITNQYASLGVLHDGSTTTPPGPPGMSSMSGLPGLESNAGDPDPNLPITVTFTTLVTQVGAYFLMGSPVDSITLDLFRADSSLIESQVILPGAMTPGPFGFNEGFIGIIANEAVASARFSPVNSPFVIDDLHFGAAVPEPGTLGLIGLALAGLGARQRKSIA